MYCFIPYGANIESVQFTHYFKKGAYYTHYYELGGDVYAYTDNILNNNEIEQIHQGLKDNLVVPSISYLNSSSTRGLNLYNDPDNWPFITEENNDIIDLSQYKYVQISHESMITSMYKDEFIANNEDFYSVFKDPEKAKAAHNLTFLFFHLIKPTETGIESLLVYKYDKNNISNIMNAIYDHTLVPTLVMESNKASKFIQESEN